MHQSTFLYKISFLGCYIKSGEKAGFLRTQLFQWDRGSICLDLDNQLIKLSNKLVFLIDLHPQKKQNNIWHCGVKSQNIEMRGV